MFPSACEAGSTSIAWGESANPRNESRIIQAPKRATEFDLAFDNRNIENLFADVIFNEFGETKCLNHT